MDLSGYVRVSRVGLREGESFISPTIQREKIQWKADASGDRIVDWHEDLDQPGSRMERPGFQAVLARIEAGEVDGIIVHKLDRFARSVADAAIAVRRIEAAGGRLVCVDDEVDTRTPQGRFFVNMLFAMAEFELERISAAWAGAREYAVRRGVHIASRAPTGYRRGDDGRLVLADDDAAAVRDVFLGRAAGDPLTELARLLESRGVLTPYGNATWTAGSVSSLLRNHAYTGEARSGEYRNPVAHPAIVSEAEWRAAQGVRPRSIPRASDGGALLSGILRCAGCRYVMKPDKMTDPRSGERVRTYRCRGVHPGGRCEGRTAVLGRVIEPFIVERFFDALGDSGVLAIGKAGEDGVMRQLEDALAAAQGELDAWQALRVSDLDQNFYIDGLRKRLSDREAAEQALAASQASELSDLPSRIDLEEIWPELETPDRRQILTAGIDAIMLRSGRVPIGDRTLVLFHGQAPTDLPARGRRVPLRPFDWPDDRP